MSLIAADYLCPEHGRFDAIEERTAEGYAPASAACRVCGAESAKVDSAIRLKFPLFEVATRGKSDAVENPRMLDTRALADGMDPVEFSERREKLWSDIEYAETKRQVG